VPYEEQAYAMDARFTKDPSDCFSVETEVREWIRAGQFEYPSEQSKQSVIAMAVPCVLAAFADGSHRIIFGGERAVVFAAA